ncbi:MAG: beta-propeller fold lactonase family protein [Chitinophagaceae bacterium]
MKHLQKIMGVAIAALCFTACQKDIKPVLPTEELLTEETTESARNSHDNNGFAGHVYTLSNQASSNKVIAYRRANDGELTFQAAYSTGGKGTGGGLGNQGALILAGDDMMLAVNAGSNTISSLKISGNQVKLISVVHSGGIMPISITKHDDLVYVLNAGGNGNISGFRIHGNGRLTPIPYSKKPLSSNSAGPAQISFVNEGKVLVITEKATNKIITYTINHFGMPGVFHSITSSTATPFGFAVRGYGNIIVSEAAGGAPGASVLSSYRVTPNGHINLVEGSVSAGQTAACWVVITDNKKYAYTTNTGSNNISSYQAIQGGGLDVLNSIAATSGAGPVDAALSESSKYLYVLNSGGNGISAYSVSHTGSLSSVQTVTGLPAGANGLAAK